MPHADSNRFAERMVLALLLLGVGVAVLFPVSDYDTFWHVANGREMVAQGRVIHEEVFSYTAYGNHRPNHEWLSQLIMYGFYRLAGADGLLLLKELLLLALTGLLYASARREGLAPWLAALLVLCAVVAGLPRHLDRPQSFTHLNLALLGWLLYGFRAGRLPALALGAVPLLILLWDFLHGAVFGLVFLAVFAGTELLKPWLVRFFPAWEGAAPMPPARRKALFLCALATLLVWVVHPLGLRTFFVFFELTSGAAQADLIQEFNPTALNRANLPFWIFLWGSLLLFALNLDRRLDPLGVLLALPFGWLAIRYMREIATFPIVLLPALAGLGAAAWRQWGGCSWQRWSRNAVVGGVALGMGWHLLQVKWLDQSPQNDLRWGHGLNESMLPMASVRFIQAVDLRGNLYNTADYGGFLSYFITPQRKIFHYNHTTLFTRYLDLMFDPAFPEKLQIEYALAGDPVEVSRLFVPPRWVPVYWEPAAMVLVRKEGLNRGVAERYGLRHFHPGLTLDEATRWAADPFVLPRLARELADHLAYRRDVRLEAILAVLAARLPERERAELLALPRPLSSPR